MYDKDFLGKNNFIWFNGVVEDRQDPQKLGRLRVRCVGIHTDNKDDLPTSDLPWSQLIHPITSSGISGLGSSPGFVVEGTWVFGYFRDGYAMQEPMVIGTLPGKPVELADVSKGFYDPNGVYPKYKDEVDTNRLATNDSNAPHLGLELRKLTRKTGVPTADFDIVAVEDHVSTEIAASDGDTWNQPDIPYSAVYPYNHVFESESGHIFEIDDTLDNERLYTAHRTGTSQEIDKNGNQVNIVKGDHYNIVSGKRQAVIEGNADITIGGRHKIFINKNGQENNHYDIQIGPNASVNIQVDKGDMNVVLKDGKMNTNVAGDYNMKIGGDMNLDVRGNKSETVSGNKTSNTTGAVIHRGSRIDLNP
tara:strand:- start:126 stop:1211 length:1086 start_codon:yes stop_codon:yes gene_type:complete